MNEKIINESKTFVGELKKSLKGIADDDLFVVSAVGNGKTAESISVATYSDLKVGSLARTKLPDLYNSADKLLMLASAVYKGVTSVVILLSDEFDTDVFQDGKVLRVCNLDA